MAAPSCDRADPVSAARSSSSSKVKPSDLPFATSAASPTPNSRILSFGSPSGGDAPSLSRTLSNKSSKSNKTSSPPESVNSGKGAAAAAAVPRPTKDDSESEESEEEDDDAPPARKSSNGKGAAAGGAAVLATQQTESPDNSDLESEEESDEYASPKGAADSSESEEEEDSDAEARRPRAQSDSAVISEKAPRKKKQMSRAATIAMETMEKDMKTRGKKGKPLSSLTADDVALTEEDIQEVS